MVPGNEGQQELFGTVLGVNEADKNGNSLRQKFEDFDEDQKKILVLGLYHSKKCGCMEVKRISE